MTTAQLGLDLHATICTLGLMASDGTCHGHQQLPTAESELIPRIVAVDAQTKRLALGLKATMGKTSAPPVRRGGWARAAPRHGS